MKHEAAQQLYTLRVTYQNDTRTSYSALMHSRDILIPAACFGLSPFRSPRWPLVMQSEIQSGCSSTDCDHNSGPGRKISEFMPLILLVTQKTKVPIHKIRIKLFSTVAGQTRVSAAAICFTRFPSQISTATLYVRGLYTYEHGAAVAVTS